MINIDIHNLGLLSPRKIPIKKAIIAGGKFMAKSSRYFEKETPKNPGEISNIPNYPEARFKETTANPLINAVLEVKIIKLSIKYKS